MLTIDDYLVGAIDERRPVIRVVQTVIKLCQWESFPMKTPVYRPSTFRLFGDLGVFERSTLDGVVLDAL